MTNIDTVLTEALRSMIREEVARALSGVPAAQPGDATADGKFYFIPEVAAELRRSEGAVRWLIHSGALKSSKLAGRRVVTQAQLDEFFEDAFGEGAVS